MHLMRVPVQPKGFVVRFIHGVLDAGACWGGEGCTRPSPRAAAPAAIFVVDTLRSCQGILPTSSSTPRRLAWEGSRRSSAQRPSVPLSLSTSWHLSLCSFLSLPLYLNRVDPCSRSSHEKSRTRTLLCLNLRAFWCAGFLRGFIANTPPSRSSSGCHLRDTWDTSQGLRHRH